VRASPTGPGWIAAKERALERAQPLGAILELTYRCNWRCTFCYNPRRFDRRALNAEEWAAVIDDLRQLGTLTVTLTGGEPLTHPEFLAIARSVSARHLALRIFTNGTLVSEPMADAIAALRSLGVEMSLHGARAETHERLTGAPGSFAALFRGLERLQRRGVPVLLKTLLTSVNEAEIDAIVALAESWGVPHQMDATVTPRDDGDLSPLRLRASDTAVTRMYRRIAERKPLPLAGREAGGVNCGLGRITLAIDPEGNVFPCMQWRHRSLGNVRETPLRLLWNDSPERRAAAETARAANDAILARGGALARHHFCPALAAQRTGDPLLPDPDHVRTAEIADAFRPRPGV
jgi:MoaA/NifB/PqqE/SkfB family radical SAM enzyme